MQIARFTQGEDPRFAVVQREGETTTLAVIAGDPLYAGIRPTGEILDFDSSIRLLAPVIPRSKILGVGRNYPDHAKEMGNEIPSQPLVFFKPNTSVIGPGDPIRLPTDSDEVHYEGELAVVISRLCKDVPAERAEDVIFGYTCANDVTARDWQRNDQQWWRAKGFDTSCPLGPYLVTDVDVSDLQLTTTLQGEVVQDSRTSDMIFDIPTLIAHISAAMTLLPGDVILTGTPAGVGPLQAGERVDVSITDIGTLSNPVVAVD